MLRRAATDDVQGVRGSVEGVTDVLARTIGSVKTADGFVAAVRAGVAVPLKVGDAVYRGDLIETGADCALCIALNDGTVFELSANARLVLNEFFCEPNGTSNSALFSLVR